MAYPNIEGKHAYDSFFSPKDYLDYLKSMDLIGNFTAPKGVIFVFQRSLMNHILETEENEEVEFFGNEVYLIKNKTLAVADRFGIGPAGVVATMEELIALGVETFLSIGLAGSLQKDVVPEHIVVCNKAIRDEGVSHHYLKSGKYASPSLELTTKLKENLSAGNLPYKEGASWTIDAPYRETVEELKTYQGEGVLTVEMEAAALCAVAEYRKVEFATAFVISDSLAELVWTPKMKDEGVMKVL